MTFARAQKHLFPFLPRTSSTLARFAPAKDRYIRRGLTLPSILLLRARENVDRVEISSSACASFKQPEGQPNQNLIILACASTLSQINLIFSVVILIRVQLITFLFKRTGRLDKRNESIKFQSTFISSLTHTHTHTRTRNRLEFIYTRLNSLLSSFIIYNAEGGTDAI